MRTKHYLTDDQKRELLNNLQQASNTQDKEAAISKIVSAVLAEGKTDNVMTTITGLLELRTPIAPDADELIDIDADVLFSPRTFSVLPLVALTLNGVDIDEICPAAEEGLEANYWEVHFEPALEDFPYGSVGSFRSKEIAEAVAKKFQELNDLISQRK